MQYREFGKTKMMLSAVGMGANRFKASDLQDPDGIEKCADLVVKAANLGVNFFDSAPTYSGGKCEEILRTALPQIKTPCYIAGKSSSYQEKTKDSVLRYIENSLQNLGRDYFDVFYMWSVKSYEQYQVIMAKDGPYDGVLAAQSRGLVKHICFSSHASSADAIKIIRDGAFEGVLVSYSLLNFKENNCVLEAARENHLGVSIMNPLGGGIIPQNQRMFAGAKLEVDRDVIEGALRFVYAHPAVSSVLCGVTDMQELEMDIHGLRQADPLQKIRQEQVSLAINSIPEFCTGCNYCQGCPKGIPVSTIMKAFNKTKFRSDSFLYNRTNPELIQRGAVFRELEGSYHFLDQGNPCVACGKCEKVCTQSLPIIKTIDTLYQWAEENCILDKAKKYRLEQLIPQGTRSIGVYTAGVYTSAMLQIIEAYLGDSPLEMIVFDSDSSKWGTLYLEKYIVKNPDEMVQSGIQLLLITNYIHSAQIYEDLIQRYPEVNIQQLHTELDLPWYF